MKNHVQRQGKKRNSNGRIMNRNDGFSLIEVVIASMLVGMILLAAFPLIMTGRSVIAGKQKEMEAEMLGDSVFAEISKELQNAGNIYFGTGEELSDQYGDRMADDWEYVDLDLQKYGYDVEIAWEPIKEEWILLSVRFMEEESVYYEREEMILLPNIGLYEENILDIHGGTWSLNRKADGSGPEDRIWCRPVY